MILDSSDEDAHDESDAMPADLAQHSAAEDTQYDMAPAQSMESSLGMASDENFAFDNAFQNYWQDSFLGFGGDLENID